MREADNKSIFLSVEGVDVARTSSLNDKHSCQLFRKAASFSSLVLLSSSVSTANFASDDLLQSSAVTRGYLVSHFRVLSSILSLSFLCSSVSEALFALRFSFLSECVSFFVHAKAALARSRNQ